MKAKLKPDALTRHTKKLNQGRNPAAGYSHEEWQFKHALEHLGDKLWPVTTRIVRGVQDHAYLVVGEIPNRHGGKLKSQLMAVPNDYLDFEDDGVEHPSPVSKDHMQYRLFIKDGMQTVQVLTSWTDGFCAFVPTTMQPPEEIAGVRTYAPGNGTLSFSQQDASGRTHGDVTVEQAKMYMQLTTAGRELLAQHWQLYDHMGHATLVNRVERVGDKRLKCWLYGEHEYTYTGDAHAGYLCEFEYEYKGAKHRVVNQSLQLVLRYFIAFEHLLKEMKRVLPEGTGEGPHGPG